MELLEDRFWDKSSAEIVHSGELSGSFLGSRQGDEHLRLMEAVIVCASVNVPSRGYVHAADWKWSLFDFVDDVLVRLSDFTFEGESKECIHDKVKTININRLMASFLHSSVSCLLEQSVIEGKKVLLQMQGWVHNCALIAEHLKVPRCDEAITTVVAGANECQDSPGGFA